MCCQIQDFTWDFSGSKLIIQDFHMGLQWFKVNVKRLRVSSKNKHLHLLSE